MSSPIRAVLFDVGGVLVRTFDHSGRQQWEARLGLPPGGAEALVLNSEPAPPRTLRPAGDFLRFRGGHLRNASSDPAVR